MSNNAIKWLVRSGAFLILLVFFIPPVAGMVGVTTFKTSFDIAQQNILYLVLAGACISIFFSFLPSDKKQQRKLPIIGESIGLGMGILSLFLVFIPQSETVFGILNEKPVFYILLFLLFLGYGLIISGVLVEAFAPTHNDSSYPYNPPPNPDPFLLPDPFPLPDIQQMSFPEGEPRLELISGDAPPVVVISDSDFHIGRNTQNHLVISNSKVSRVHVRIRGAQGAWFIQDQNSSSGTYVNGKRIQAQRLNDGDQVRIGETTFAFRL
jgi:hypothetical protein